MLINFLNCDFFYRRAQWTKIFMDLRGVCIDAGEKTEHRSKNFIMALTIDLHRPLLALEEVLIVSLTRSEGHRTIYENSSNWLFPHWHAEASLFLNESIIEYLLKIFGKCLMCGVYVCVCTGHKSKYFFRKDKRRFPY